MKPTWEQIVDYARGAASPEAAALVEADPDSLDRARRFAKVSSSLRQGAPDSFVNRAKALLPNLPAAKRLLRGVLTFQAAGMAQGFRSAGALARDLSFEFGEASCTLRIEPIPQSERVSIAGVFVGENLEHVKAHAGPESEAWCDEFGQFVLEAPESVSEVFFDDAFSGDQYVVNLK